MGVHNPAICSAPSPISFMRAIFISSSVPQRNASPELSPKTATATAIASSKLFPAAVNESVANSNESKASYEPCGKGNAQVDCHTLRNLSDTHLHDASLKTEPLRSTVMNTQA